MELNKHQLSTKRVFPLGSFKPTTDTHGFYEVSLKIKIKYGRGQAGRVWVLGQKLFIEKHLTS